MSDYSSELVNVSTGDTVRAVFGHYPKNKPEERERKVRIIEVRERFGYCGKFRTAPLIIGIDLRTGKKDHFDQSFIVEVLSRRPTRPYLPPVNVFKEHGSFVHYCGGTMEGDLVMLASAILSRLPYWLNRGIDETKLLKFFLKTKPGLLKYGHGMFKVRKKPFVRWVTQNAYRIVATTKDMNIAATREYEMDNADWDALDALDD